MNSLFTESASVLEVAADVVRELSLGGVRVTLVEAEEREAVPAAVRIDLRRARQTEAYLRIHCPISDAVVAPQLLRLLADRGAAAAGHSAELLAQGITDLLEQACADYLDREQAAATDHSQLLRHSMWLAIQGFARSRLADPELKPEMLARQHHISVRYLQKLFSEYGESPASWIRDERLNRCRDELRDPRLDHLTVAAIGERSGLYGASHFSRLFRQRYGITPRDYRRAPADRTTVAA